MLEPKVFFVDDDEVTLFLYKRLAKKFDLDAVYCLNGKELMDKLENVSSGIIVLDINMPVMNGIEVVKQLELEDRILKFNIMAMLGASNTQEIKDQLEQYGVSNFVEKPLKSETLKLLLEPGVN